MCVRVLWASGKAVRDLHPTALARRLAAETRSRWQGRSQVPKRRGPRETPSEGPREPQAAGDLTGLFRFASAHWRCSSVSEPGVTNQLVDTRLMCIVTYACRCVYMHVCTRTRYRHRHHALIRECIARATPHRMVSHRILSQHTPLHRLMSHRIAPHGSASHASDCTALCGSPVA